MTAASAPDPPATGGPASPGQTRPVAAGTTLRERGTVCHEEVRARRWDVRGIAKVVRGIEVDLLRCDGTAVVGGPLVAGELTVAGALEARGPVTVGRRLRVRGSIDAGASVHAHDASFEGPVRLGGELVVDGALRLRGALRAPAVRCEQLRVRGTVAVPGTIASPTIEAVLLGDSSVGSVECRELRLRGPVVNVVERVLGREAVVEVGRVEAEKVWVEGARVGFLRAQEIVLGRGAHVTATEGRVVRAHPSSRVGPESWSRPPLGLSR